MNNKIQCYSRKSDGPRGTEDRYSVTASGPRCPGIQTGSSRTQSNDKRELTKLAHRYLTTERLRTNFIKV